jgi:hypothetical protein
MIKLELSRKSEKDSERGKSESGESDWENIVKEKKRNIERLKKKREKMKERKMECSLSVNGMGKGWEKNLSMEVNLGKESMFNIYKGKQRYSSKPMGKGKQMMRSFQGNFLEKEGEKRMIYNEEGSKKVVNIPIKIAKTSNLQRKIMQKTGKKKLLRKMDKEVSKLSKFNKTQPIVRIEGNGSQRGYTSNMNNFGNKGYVSIYSTNLKKINSLKQIPSKKTEGSKPKIHQIPNQKQSLRKIKLGDVKRPKIRYFHTQKYYPKKQKMFKSPKKKINMESMLKYDKSPYEFNTQLDIKQSDSFTPLSYMVLEKKSKNVGNRKIKSKMKRKKKSGKFKSIKPKKVFVPESFLENGSSKQSNKFVKMFFKENNPRKVKIEIKNPKKMKTITIGKPKKIKGGRKFLKSKEFRPFDFKNQKKTSIFYKEYEKNRNK